MNEGIDAEEASLPALAILAGVVFVILLLIVYKFPEAGEFVIRAISAVHGG